MFKAALVLAVTAGLLTVCGNDDKEKNPETGNEEKELFDYFKEAKPPYVISDTFLVKNTDTALLPSSVVAPLIADSIKNYFGKNATIRYTPLAKLNQKGKENYFLIKASSRNKAAAVLLVANEKNEVEASYPFLLADADANTTQHSSLDKNFTITKTVILRSGSDIVGEGKEVLGYDAASKSFSLIMEDPLKDNEGILRNLIDTFPKTHKLAGDYMLNKKNIVAIRDGRHANHLLVFIHTENETGDCIGQMKGEFVLQSPTMATYRQGGDPCILNLSFNGNTVSVEEESGCGNYRGLDCKLSGTFTRKMQPAAKLISPRYQHK